MFHYVQRYNYILKLLWPYYKNIFTYFCGDKQYFYIVLKQCVKYKII